MKRFLKHHVLPLFSLFIAHVLVFAPFIFRDAGGTPYKMIRWDFESQYYPWLVYISDVIRAGEWPLWSPYVAAGTPFFINPQNALYSPITLLVSLLFGYTHYVAQLQSIILMFVASVGAYGLSFALWRNRAGALGTALAFGLSIAIFGNLQHATYINAFAWMPWLFWMIWEAIHLRRRWAYAGLVLVIYQLFVAAYPAIVAMILLWGMAWGLYLIWQSTQTTREKLLTITSSLGAGAFALGMAAVFWLPILYYRNEFSRGAPLDLETALIGGNLSFKHLWGMLFHFLTVQPLPGPNADLSMRGVFVGALILPLIGVALVFLRDRWTAVLTVFSFTTFLMACGGDFFGRVALHAIFPAMNFSRFPAGDSRTLMALGLALLAGRGLALLFKGGKEERRVFRLGLYGLAAIQLLGLGIFSIVYSPEDYASGPLTFVPITLLLVGLALAVLPSLPMAWARGAVICLIFLDLGIAAHANSFVAGAKPNNYGALRARHQTSFDMSLASLPRQRGALGSLLEPGLSEPANVGYVSKQFFLGEYNPLRLGRLNHLLGLGLEDWMLNGPRLSAWAGDLPPETSEVFLKEVKAIQFAFLDYQPNKVVYRVQVNEPTLLVFNEVYFPGWMARWSGQERPMEEVLGGLRALRVEPGDHQIETFFAPKVVFWGAGLSLLSLFGWLGWLFWILRRRQAELPAPTRLELHMK